MARLTRSEEQYVDDVAEINGFARLYTECAVVALWRCVELFRKRAIAQACGAAEAKAAFRHRDFCQMLEQLRISESKLRCARSVNELRCLNNAVKHEGRIAGELATLSRWKGRSGKELADLRPHYIRLRPLTEHYIRDLAERATKWWESKPA